MNSLPDPPSKPELREGKPDRPPENPWVEALKTVVISAVLALGIRTFVAEARYIPSGSMLPTLQINDRLLIDKLSYRFAKPERGDIIVFNPPAALRAQNFHEAFIKRIIGLPGDVVKVQGGTVYVNGCALKEPYIAARPDYTFSTQKLNAELGLPGNKVPPNQYLVLGDNRNDSYDSHYWGYVPDHDIIGKAVFRFWPLNHMGDIEQHPVEVCPVKTSSPTPAPTPRS